MYDLKKNPYYRPEIDGLRAFAVIFVIFFHLQFPLFHGGYIGVDIFFVISGYLISSIILRDINNNNFNIYEFYLRRVRRIIPVLSFVILSTFVLALFVLLPYQLIDFSFSAISSIFFFSNFYFWQYSGYFSPNSDSLPLLHTWSLSIEEQYYIIYPIVLLIFINMLKLKKTTFILFLILSILSIFFSQFSGNLKIIYPYFEKNFIFFNQSSFASFYLPFGRIWELLIGYFLFNYSKKSLESSIFVKNLFSIIGCILLIYSLLFFDKNSPHPGIITVIPVFGTSLIILFCDKKTIIFNLIANNIIVFIGLISYSLYLWHHPLFVLINLYFEEIIITNYIFYFFVLFTISFISWKYIEIPFRNKSLITNKFLFISILSLYLLIILLVCFSILSKGFIDRYDDKDKNLISNSNIKYSKFVEKNFNNFKNNDYVDNKKNILIIGDSQAQDFVNVLSLLPQQEQYNFRTIYISSKCQIYYPDVNDKINENITLSNKSLCMNENNLIDIERFYRRYDNIFLISSWRLWSVNMLNDTINKMKLSDNQKIFVVGPKDFGNIKIKNYLNKSLLEKQSFTHKIDKITNKINEKLSKNSSNYRYINIIKSICENNICPKFTDEGNLISYDGGHLTPEGAKYIFIKLKDKLTINDFK